VAGAALQQCISRKQFVNRRLPDRDAALGVSRRVQDVQFVLADLVDPDAPLVQWRPSNERRREQESRPRG
jgi:hypothetical protein